MCSFSQSMSHFLLFLLVRMETFLYTEMTAIKKISPFKDRIALIEPKPGKRFEGVQNVLCRTQQVEIQAFKEVFSFKLLDQNRWQSSKLIIFQVQYVHSNLKESLKVNATHTQHT